MLTRLDRTRYVLGDASEHVGFLNCERIADREHIHDWRVDAHYHEGLAQLFFFSRGTVKGRIDTESVQIKAPALVWLPALVNHGFDYPKDMQGWVITVPSADVARLAEQANWLKRWIDMPLVLHGKPIAQHLRDAKSLVMSIEREHRRATEERNCVLESYFFLLLICVFRSLKVQGGPATAASDQHQALSWRFHKLLDDQIQTQRTVLDYAQLLTVTPTHLSRSIKAATGCTASELIHRRVMLEAKRRLVFSSAPIAQIADQLGFSSPAYFSRFFSERAGQSPGQFRKHRVSRDALD